MFKPPSHGCRERKEMTQARNVNNGFLRWSPVLVLHRCLVVRWPQRWLLGRNVPDITCSFPHAQLSRVNFLY